MSPREPTVRAAALEGVLVVEPEVVRDERGFFVRTLDRATLVAAGIDPATFVQENQSRSRLGTVRGLHGRRELTEGKLVRCAHGAIFEVVVDLRPVSPTFLEWEVFVLDDEEHRQVWVPPGCVHGFQVVSQTADVCYRHDAPYAPGLDLAIRWDDEDLAIPWPDARPIVSERDRSAPRLADVRAELVGWFGPGDST